jgi:hypothetical protein
VSGLPVREPLDHEQVNGLLWCHAVTPSNFSASLNIHPSTLDRLAYDDDFCSLGRRGNLEESTEADK